MGKSKNSDLIRVFLVSKKQKICLKNALNYVDIMPKERIKQFKRMQKQGDRLNCILSYLTLYYALKKFKGINNPPIFIYDKNKKPNLTLPNISFNISHTKNIVAVSISKNPVGIDAETKRPINLKIAKKICCHNEYKKFIRSCNKENFIFSTWTKKEAFCKRKSISIFNNFSKIDSTSLKNTKSFFYDNSAISISHNKSFRLKVFLIRNPVWYNLKYINRHKV